ncbi:MAG: PorV/PorQ family protein [Candidatus Cloacimonetes bacterium]|nr:PorV/PorQ family protein [Candidatus Cloacimonadota bacterium]
MKNKNLVKLLLIMAIAIIPMFAHATSQAGVLFLLIEPGSRANGMAEAYVAKADDPYSGWWNPGAMAFNRKNQIGAMHVNWFQDAGIDDLFYEYLGWNNYYEGIGNLGFHIIYLTYGKMDRTSEDGENLGTFNSYEVAPTFSYATEISPNIGVGVNFKVVLSDLAPEGTGHTDTRGRGMSFAFDLGMKYKNIFSVNRLDWGVNLQNIGPDITYVDDEQSDPLPMNLRTGLSYRPLDDQYNLFTINADMSKILANDDFVLARLGTAWVDDPSDQEIDETIFSVGMEYVYIDMISLRGGYYYDKLGSVIGPSFGAGLKYKFNNKYLVFFDFAMKQAGELTSYNKTFSLGLEF